jgi:hypothetical protein
MTMWLQLFEKCSKVQGSKFKVENGLNRRVSPPFYSFPSGGIKTKPGQTRRSAPIRHFKFFFPYWKFSFLNLEP